MLGCAALLLLVTCFVRGRYERDLAYLIGIAGFVGAAIAVFVIWDYGGGDWVVFSDQLQVDRFGNVIRVIVCGTGLITLFASLGWRTAVAAAGGVRGPAAGGGVRHVDAGRRQHLRVAVRGARALLHHALPAVRLRDAQQGVAGERPEVPRAGLGGLRDPALRLGVPVRRDRLAALRRGLAWRSATGRTTRCSR